MVLKDTGKQLQFDNEKYVISSNFYNYLITQTNSIGNYNTCRSFVRNAINKALNGEVTKVTSFEKKKIDFEL